MAAQVHRPVSRIESEVRRIRALIEGREFAVALDASERLLRKVPENRDVFYLLAVSQRYAGRVADALRTLLRFEVMHPEYGRLFQERGHCYRAVGEPGAAIAAYQQAVSLNPTLRASWNALEELQRAAGELAEARSAARQVQRLAELPSNLVRAAELLYEGDAAAAEPIVRRFLQGHPDHIEAMRLLAQIGLRLDALEEAELLLERALALAPDDQTLRYDYAILLAQMHKPVSSFEAAQRLLHTEPDNRAYRAAYACACVGIGKYDQALRLYRDLATQSPSRADLRLSMAHVLKALGKQDEAIESYRMAAVLRPSYGEAYWGLANLKTYRFSDEEVRGMQVQLASEGTSRVDRYQLCFALGKALEDRSQFRESFSLYARGNALRSSDSQYKAMDTERNARLQMAVCTQEFFTARKGVGCERPGPIFIVGLPRSGSTLIEQILASHSMVEATMELADITRLANSLQGSAHDAKRPRYPGILAQLSRAQLRAMGERYLRETQALRTGKPYFIDKMPNNFRHIGLIHLMLPHAKIIDARREAMACCFSNFKQLFASGQEFTYSLEHLGHYYRCYAELMNHWDTVLPRKVLHVQYEEVVADLPGAVRRILDFCGLQFEANCIEFYKSERSVHTASSEQVRRPIFKESLQQWRHFEPWLADLRAALQV